MNDFTQLDKFLSLSVSDRQRNLRAGNVKLTDIATATSRRIEESLHLNAFITPSPDLAQAKAAEIDVELNVNATFPLAGVLLAVKDNISLEGLPLTCASKILEGYTSLFTATALERLIEAGAVIVGKTNLDEFAMGSSTEHSCNGPTLNPFDNERVPGGSSGGSAAAVAAGLATAALGSETGGSVRQPAAFCGVVGLKPTYGRVSRYGLVAFGSSLDQIGVFAKTADECARVFEVMAGLDPNDNTSSPEKVMTWDAVLHPPRTPDAYEIERDKPLRPVSEGADTLSRLMTKEEDIEGPIEFERGLNVAGMRIGLPREYLENGVQKEIAEAVNRAATLFRRYGAIVEPCSLPHTKYAIPTYYILAPAEASSNLARYDGVRYGSRAKPKKKDEIVEEEDLIRLSRQAGFGSEVKRRIMIGTYVLSSGYYDAYYLKAQRVRRLIRDDFLSVFRKYDLLLTPTTPTTAFKIGEKASDPISMYLSDIFTAPANLAGIPAISVPFGADEKGLPIGIQLMAADFREDRLLAAAVRLERSEK